MEDKQLICDALFATLKLTRSESDLEELKYAVGKDGTEKVYACYEMGVHTFDVTGDSGLAMIRNIINKL